MSIKINGKSLLKGQINGKEINKIVINGNTVYTSAPALTVLTSGDNLYYSGNNHTHTVSNFTNLGEYYILFACSASTITLGKSNLTQTSIITSSDSPYISNSYYNRSNSNNPSITITLGAYYGNYALYGFNKPISVSLKNNTRVQTDKGATTTHTISVNKGLYLIFNTLSNGSGTVSISYNKSVDILQQKSLGTNNAANAPAITQIVRIKEDSTTVTFTSFQNVNNYVFKKYGNVQLTEL